MSALPDAADRVLWLLLVPAVASVSPWLLLAMLHAADVDVGTGALIICAVLPALGAGGAFAYAWSRLTLRTAAHLVPYAALAIGFCAFLLLGTVDRPPRIDDVPKWMDLVDLLAILVAFLLPIAALIGGALSLQAAKRLMPW